MDQPILTPGILNGRLWWGWNPQLPEAIGVWGRSHKLSEARGLAALSEFCNFTKIPHFYQNSYFKTITYQCKAFGKH